MARTVTPTISLVPQAVNLRLYAGDGVSLRLVATDSDGLPVDLTGTVTAQIRSKRAASFALIDFAADLADGADGIAILTLTGSQTAELHAPITDGGPPQEEFEGVWDAQWTPADSLLTVTLLQGEVESSLDVTRS